MVVDRSQAGTNRDARVQRGQARDMPATMRISSPAFHREVRRAVPPSTDNSACFVIEGADPGAGVTSLPLGFGVLQLGSDEPGVPVVRAMTMQFLAISFMADNVPAGPGTITLHRRPEGGSFSPAATFEFNTSN